MSTVSHKGVSYKTIQFSLPAAGLLCCGRFCYWTFLLWEIVVLDYFAVGDSTAGLFCCGRFYCWTFLPWEILMLDFLASGQMNRQAFPHVGTFLVHTIRRNLNQFLTPPLLPISDVVYGRPLAEFWYQKVASNQPSFHSQALKSK